MAKDYGRDQGRGPAESYWRSFPRLEKLISVERPPVLDGMEATCRELDRILKTGTPVERSRAQAALTGYARALELYRQLVEMRDRAISEASNTRRAGADK